MTIKRYDISTSVAASGRTQLDIYEDPEGEWVKFEDVAEGKCPQDKIETVRSWMLDINMAANLVEAKKDEEDREALLHNIRELAGQSRRLLDTV